MVLSLPVPHPEERGSASRRMKARLVASPFETRAKGALLRVRVRPLKQTPKSARRRRASRRPRRGSSSRCRRARRAARSASSMPRPRRAYLYRGALPVDRALPDRFARPPRRDQLMWIARCTIGADEAHRDALGLARDVEADLRAVEPHRAAPLALHGAAVQLSRNLPLAFAEHVIDGGRDRSEPPRHLALRHAGTKPLG